MWSLLFLLLFFQPDPVELRKIYEDHVLRCEKDFGLNDARTAEAARDLGFYLKGNGDNSAAASAFAKALRIDQFLLGSDAWQAVAGMVALASVSPPHDAEALLRKALTSPNINSTLAVPALSTLGDLRFAAKDRTGAAAAWKLALQHAELVNGKESDSVARVLYSVSQVTDTKESVELLERARDIAIHNFGAIHPETATCEVHLADALLKDGRPVEAAAHAQTAVTAFEASLGSRHPRVAVALTTLARTRSDAKSAAALYRQAIEIDRQSLGDKDSQTLADVRALRAFLKQPGLKQLGLK